MLRGASGVRRSPSADCPSTGRAVGVRYPRVVGAGVRVWGPFSVPSACTPCGGCGPRGGSVAFVCRGAGWGGGGVRRTPRLCVRGGPLGRGVALPRSVSLPSLGRQQCRCHWRRSVQWGASPPIPLRFMLARLLWAPSVRRLGALERARLFSAAPVGTGGWGGGAGRAPASLSGRGGDQPPMPRGVQAGAPAACGPSGGAGGGGRAAASLPPFWVAACGTPSWPPSRRQRTPLRHARAVGVAVLPRGGDE